MLEDCAYEFVRDYGKSGDNHAGAARGVCIESIVFTREKLAAMGLPANALGPRWWIGFELPPDLFAKVKSGERLCMANYKTLNLSCSLPSSAS